MDNTPTKKSVAKKAGIGCLGIIVLFFALLPVIAAIDGWNRYKSGKESLKWPSAEGVILSSEVKTDLGKSDDADPKYTAAITYRYAVEGYEYTGERVSFAGQTFLKKGRADSLVMRYNKGKRVKVCYNPETPHISVLEAGADSGPPIFSIVLLLGIFFFLFKIFRSYLKKKKVNRPNVPPLFTPQKPPPAPASTSAIGSAERSSGLPRSKSKPDKNLGILTLALLAAGIGLLAWGGYEIKRAYESRSWPHIQGTITSSDITKETRRDSNSRHRTTYYPRVKYKYYVDVKYYSCNRIEFGGVSGGKRSKAKKVVDRYPSGKKVTVYYNPQDPAVAVLKAGFSWGALFAFLGGLIFFGAGIMCFRTYRRNKEEQYTSGRPPYDTRVTGG